MRWVYFCTKNKILAGYTVGEEASSVSLRLTDILILESLIAENVNLFAQIHSISGKSIFGGTSKFENSVLGQILYNFPPEI